VPVIASVTKLARGAATGSASLLLRLVSLAGKLALSLYMAKFFTLSELGIYGLAFAAVMFAIVLFGFRVDYIVAREILGMTADKQRRVGTTVAALYLGSFVLAAPFALGALFIAGESRDMTLLLLIYALCGVEAYANFLYTVTIALKRPALANALFFVRSGLWTIPAMAISYFDPAYRNVEFVLACWLAGASASVLLNMWLMRGRLIGPFESDGFDWAAVRSFCSGAFLVWVGSVAVTLGMYLDRFVLASFLTLQDVGVATFYISFTMAALTLVQSATTSVTFPSLIEHFDSGRIDAFQRELKRTLVIAAILAFGILAVLGAVMPFMGDALGKPELLSAYPAFLVLLAATWIRTHAETLYYGLFVKRQHRAIWLGNLIFLAASLLLNLIFVPLYGLSGLAIAALLASLVILAWRAVLFAKGGQAVRGNGAAGED
jgi:O-antigen/teichoic acid export membrane protein